MARAKVQANSTGEQLAGIVESVRDLLAKFALLDQFHDRAAAAAADCWLFLGSCVDAVGGIDWFSLESIVRYSAGMPDHSVSIRRE